MAMFEINITKPPTHFDALHREMWDSTVSYPTFVPTREAFVELTSALEAHIVYRRLAAEITAIQRSGKQPGHQLQAACSAACRPYKRLLKKLAT